MNTKGVIGKRIVAVKQRRLRTRDYQPEFCWHIDWVELEDGTRLVFDAVETDFGEYFIDGTVAKPVREEKR